MSALLAQARVRAMSDLSVIVKGEKDGDIPQDCHTGHALSLIGCLRNKGLQERHRPSDAVRCVKWDPLS